MKFIRKMLQRSDKAIEEELTTENRISIKGSNDIKSIFNAIKNDLAEYFTNPDYIFHEKAFDD